MTSQDKLLYSSNRVLLLLLSLQSCLTLCDPVDGSPPSFPVPGILQARTPEWVAISFSNACKWKVKVKSLSHVRLFSTPWTAAYQAPPSMGFSRQEYWSGVPLLLSNKKEQTTDTCNKVNESQKHYIILRERHLAAKSIHCTIYLFESLKHVILIYDGRKPKNNNCLWGWSGNKNWLGTGKENFLFDDSIFWYRVGLHRCMHLSKFIKWYT